MKKELQDYVWQNCLPKEFKEEVKELYDGCIKMMDIRPSASQIYANILSTLEGIFGLHNLTSDAEGEEMLTVSRKVVQEEYRESINKAHPYNINSYNRGFHVGCADMLKTLFGSKCLPDEKEFAENANCSNVDSPEVNVDSLDGNVESLETEPAEPKYKVDDKVRYQDFICTVYQIEESYYLIRNLAGGDLIGWLKESDLEPYTEPEDEHQHDDTAQKSADVNSNRNLSQKTADCDKEFYNILKNSFAKDRRLNIAAKMLQALVCAPIISGVDPNPPAEQLVQTAFRLADALIAECEKGGMK